jgi:hypothetical protein
VVIATIAMLVSERAVFNYLKAEKSDKNRLWITRDLRGGRCKGLNSF